MDNKIIIFGKASCPFTKAAIDDFTKKGISFNYIDVVEEPDQIDKMLAYSNGDRKIPVIVEGGKVTQGFHGKG